MGFPFPCMECFGCRGNECHALTGQKLEWPELVGVPAEVAIQKIEAENPHVKGVRIPFGNIIPFDSCCNRVLVVVRRDNTVEYAPLVG